MSAIILPEQFKPLPNGVKICLTRANSRDSIHRTAVANEVYKVIENDALAHGVKYEGKGFMKVLDAFQRNKIQAYFIIVERENCRPVYAGGAIQFPTVITEWNGRNFDHFPATYSEDTWVDRTISDEVRQLTISADFPKGVGLGTVNTRERIKLSVAGAVEDLPFGMISKGRVSENASDNQRQLAILKRLGATLDVERSAVIEFNAVLKSGIGQGIEVDTYGFGAQNSETGLVSLLPNVFLTSWSSDDEDHKIVGTHTEGISTTTGDTILRSQYRSNGNLPSAGKLKQVMASMISAAQEEVLRRVWTSESDIVFLDNVPVMRAHVYEPEIVSALKQLGGTTRQFGDHIMVPGVINYTNVRDMVLPGAEPLTVIQYSYAAKRKSTGSFDQRADQLASLSS